MSEGGYSWPEAVLTLTVMMVIFGTLLPLASTMSFKLQMKKTQMYAAETALHGAIYFKAYSLQEGVREVEGVNYNWSIEGSAVCVSYRIANRVGEKCVNP